MSEFTKGKLKADIESGEIFYNEPEFHGAETRIADIPDIHTKEQKANATELVHRWNAFEDGGIVSELQQELLDYKAGCEGLKLAIQDIRPYADCYKRICEHLGIEKDVLGYIEKLKQQIVKAKSE